MLRKLLNQSVYILSHGSNLMKYIIITPATKVANVRPTPQRSVRQHMKHVNKLQAQCSLNTPSQLQQTCALHLLLDSVTIVNDF